MRRADSGASSLWRPGSADRTVANAGSRGKSRREYPCHGAELMPRLRRVDCARPGLTRRRRGRGSLPRRPRQDGPRAAELERNPRLAIPPAWTTSGSAPTRTATCRPSAWTAPAAASTSTTSVGGKIATGRSSTRCWRSRSACRGCAGPRRRGTSAVTACLASGCSPVPWSFSTAASSASAATYADENRQLRARHPRAAARDLGRRRRPRLRLRGQARKQVVEIAHAGLYRVGEELKRSRRRDPSFLACRNGRRSARRSARRGVGCTGCQAGKRRPGHPLA